MDRHISHADTAADVPLASRVQPVIRDARAVRTRHALNAAMLALLERKPLEQITVRDITAEAGISYATFFRHHPSKEALLDQVAADRIDRLVELTLPVMDAVDSAAAFSLLTAHVEEHRALWTALLTGGAAGAVREELLRVSSAVAVGRTPADAWLPVELSVSCTVSLMIEIITWWLRQPAGAQTPEYVATILDRVVLPPMMRPPT